MSELQIRLTPRVVSLIGSIERISGRLDGSAVQSILAGYTSVGDTDLLEALKLREPAGPSHAGPARSIPELLEWSFSRENALFIRTTKLTLHSGTATDELFETIQPFLIERRLTELFAWLQHELDGETNHPLLLISTFHLVFLQIAPFERLNLEAAALLFRSHLQQSGYEWVRCTRLLTKLFHRGYFLALKQAEKSVFTNWSTTAIFTETVLGAILQAGEELQRRIAREHGQTKLTPVQQRIIEVVRETNGATREQIADAAGINPSTVKYNLGVLSGRGVLERFGAGRTTSYRVG